MIDAKTALSMHMGLPDAWVALAMSYAKCGHFDWAMEALDEAARQDEPTAAMFDKERIKIKKLAEKQKAKTPRGGKSAEPWLYSEAAVAPKPGDRARAVPVLEMDSLGGMTIRSQVKILK